jgi:hypothetical protein
MPLPDRASSIFTHRSMLADALIKAFARFVALAALFTAKL